MKPAANEPRTEANDARRVRVVIVGAGFGGLWAAREVARFNVEVLLLDENNYHTFLPLLYQVAAGELEPEEIAHPVRSILRKLRNAQFVMAEVKGIDFATKLVRTDTQVIAYDFLVLATGSESNFFGIPGAADCAFPLKTLPDAIAIRSHILSCFERATQEPDALSRQRMLTFVIVGAGPTGVEFAGALAELIRGALVKDYTRLDFREVRVILLEALGRPLSGMPERLQKYTIKRLVKMGVEVQLSALVVQITPEAVHLKDASLIPTETVIWTAGVRGDPSAQMWGLPTLRNEQVSPLPTLQVADYPEVYVVGDLAHSEKDGRPLPMIAPVAIQQGLAAARNIARQIAGETPKPFRYNDRGTMVTIGRNAGVAHLYGRGLTGFPAWVVWLAVHLYNLIGFRNRLFVLIDWAWDYIFLERAVRLILPVQTRQQKSGA